jgi:YggT family protein
MFFVIDLINWAFSLYSYIVIAMIVMSLLISFGVVSYNNPNVRQTSAWLAKMTDPLLNPIRRFLPAMGGLDFSPMVLFLIMQFVQTELNIILRRAFYGA